MSKIEHILEKERQNSSINVQALCDFIYTPSIAKQMKNLSLYKPHFHDLNIFNKSRLDLIKKSVEQHKEHMGSNRIERDKLFFLPYVLKASMAWPLTLHTSMFIKCIQMLGTQAQQKQWFQKAYNFEIFGCYAQTELGHGSDVQSLQTTATYSLQNDTFIINTPSISAAKFWPGDLGIWATHALIFAQLVIHGKNYGVHAFMVQIRDIKTFELMPGVEAGDIGPKFGFHSKDNGYLLLNNVVIPKRNMLRRFVSVSKTGEIKKKGDPKVSYATMMITRQTISTVFPRVYSQAITIACRYSLFRVQFLNAEKIQIPIINYQAQKDKIISRTAQYIALCIAGNAVKNVSDRNLELVKQKNDFSLMAQSHSCLCLSKAIFTQIAYEGIETCRRACGGHGFSHYSGIPSLLCQFASNLTLQGQNTILYIQVTRYLLKNYKYSLTKKKKVGESVQYMQEMNEYLSKRISSDRFDWKLWTIQDIYTLLVQSACHSLSMVANKMMNKPENMSSLDVWNRAAGCDIRRAAFCHAYLYIFTHFKRAVEKDTCLANREVIRSLCMLFGADSILKNSAPVIEGGFVDGEHLSALQRMKEIQLQLVRPHLVKVIDAFGIPEQYIQSALTQGDPYENYLQLARNNELNHSVQEGALIIRNNIQQAILKNQSKL